MRRWVSLHLVVLVLAALAAGQVGAAPASRSAYLVEATTSVARERVLQAERARGTSIGRVFRRVMPGFATRLTTADARRLRRDPGVVRVVRDRSVRVVSNTPLQSTSPGLWGLDRIDQRSLPLDGQSVMLNAGPGIPNYVVDTGIREQQVRFAGRLRPGVSVVGDGNGTEDCNGHGTRVAGVIAGAETGVAPASLLIPVRVLDCRGNGDGAALIAGLDWVLGVHSARTPGVVNISLHGPYNAIVNDAVAAVVAHGLVVTVAAGNLPGDVCAGSPTSEPSAIRVGAISQGDVISPFSGTGSCVDILAPGDGVLTTTTVTRRDAAAQNQLVFASGTSIASAFVAGAADIVLAANPAARPADVIQGLLASATPDVVSGVPPAMPNRLLYVGTGAQPAMAVGASAAALGPVFSCVTAIFVPRSSSSTATGRYELEGTVALPGVLSVTIGGRLLARRHIGAGEFSFLTRRIARGVSRVRFALKPDDRGTSVKSVLVRTVRWL